MRIAPLRSVRIENFRSFRSVEIALHPEVTVFFGANAAGKTTVLDALAIVLGALPARVPKATGRDFAKTGDIRVPWKDRVDVGEMRGAERPYARVAATAADGVAWELQWDVTRFRSVQDRHYAPAGLGTKALHEVLDPIVRATLDTRPGTLPEPIPLVAAYGTERAVVDVPLRERDFNTEFHRFAGLDHSLKATTRFKTVFEWFRVMEDQERREGKDRLDFGFELPELQWVRRAVERAELHCKNPRVETKPIRMLIDFEHENGATEPSTSARSPTASGRIFRSSSISRDGWCSSTRTPISTIRRGAPTRMPWSSSTRSIYTSILRGRPGSCAACERRFPTRSLSSRLTPSRWSAR